MTTASQLPHQPLEDDVEAVRRLDAMDTMLRVLARTTGLRIALVARVRPDDWTCCAVLDEAGFGLQVGDQLDVATTY
jgi:hypothetical protein